MLWAALAPGHGGDALGCAQSGFYPVGFGRNHFSSKSKSRERAAQVVLLVELSVRRVRPVCRVCSEWTLFPGEQINDRDPSVWQSPGPGLRGGGAAGHGAEFCPRETSLSQRGRGEASGRVKVASDAARAREDSMARAQGSGRACGQTPERGGGEGAISQGPGGRIIEAERRPSPWAPRVGPATPGQETGRRPVRARGGRRGPAASFVEFAFCCKGIGAAKPELLVGPPPSGPGREARTRNGARRGVTSP